MKKSRLICLLSLLGYTSNQLVYGQTSTDKYGNIELIPQIGFSKVNWIAPDLSEKVNLIQIGISGKFIIPHQTRNSFVLYADAFYSLGVAQSTAQLTSVTNPVTHNSEKINSRILANHSSWNTGFRLGYSIDAGALTITPQAGLAYRNWNRNPASADNSLVITHQSKYNLFQSQLGVEASIKMSPSNQFFILVLCEPGLHTIEKQSKFNTNDNFETIKQLYVDATVPQTPENLEAVNTTINALRNSSQTLKLTNSVNWFAKAGVTFNQAQLSLSYEKFSFSPPMDISTTVTIYNLSAAYRF